MLPRYLIKFFIVGSLLQFLYADQEINSHLNLTYTDLNRNQILSKRDILNTNGDLSNEFYGDVEIIGASAFADGKLSDSSFATFDFASKNKTERENIDGSKVVFARLYWVVGIYEKWSATQNADNQEKLKHKYLDAIKNFEKITFITPNAKFNLTADTKDIKWHSLYSSQEMEFIYQNSADVTNIIKRSLGKDEISRKFGIEDIKALQGQKISTIDYAGWALVIVYDFGDENNGKIKPKRVNLYDGLAILQSNKTSKNDNLNHLELKFDDFYMQESKNFKSNLSILSFGSNNKNIQILTKNGQKSISLPRKNIKFDTGINLQTYDISKFIQNEQPNVELKILAKDSKDSDDEINKQIVISFAALSTDLAMPNLCYNEEFFIKTQDDKFVKLQDGKTHDVVAGDVLRTRIEIRNQSDTQAQNIILTTNIIKSNLIDDSIIINPYLPSNANFIQNGFEKMKLWQKTGNGFMANLGKLASTKSGGFLDPNDTHKAVVQYDLMLNENFKTFYDISFQNQKEKLKYSGKLKKCNTQTTKIKVHSSKFQKPDLIAVSDKNKDGLYTQIADKSFKATIINQKNTALLNDAYVDIVADFKNCQNAKSVLQGGAIVLKNGTTAHQKELLNLKVKDAYANLHFRFTTNDKSICQENSFSTRPKELKLYGEKENIIGGKAHDLELKALTNGDQVAKNYSSIFNSRSNILNLVAQNECISDKNYQLQATFNNGVAKIKNHAKSISSLKETDEFLYEGIGEFILQASDTSWTQTDQQNGGCVKNSSLNEPDSDGKIGCNISLNQNEKIIFIPARIDVENLSISNFKNLNATYLSNNQNMAANLKFNLIAKLENGNTAKHFSKNCYAQDVFFEINLIKKIENKILFFYKDKLIDNNFTIKANEFQNGKGTVKFDVNFQRDSKKPIEPFVIYNSDFLIKNIKTNNVKSQNFKTLDNQTSANFYYARAFVPDYSLQNSQDKGKIYYVIFCKECEKNGILEGANVAPGLRNWYINKFHDSNFGSVEFISNRLEIEKINMENGVENFTVRSKQPTKERLRFIAPEWLNFQDNVFNISYIGDLTNENEWGGVSTKSNKQKFIQNSQILYQKSNQRIQW
ncbi:MAG: hypothetical protein ACTTJC_08895 [Campylobacter sp.]